MGMASLQLKCGLVQDSHSSVIVSLKGVGCGKRRNTVSTAMKVLSVLPGHSPSVRGSFNPVESIA